MNNEWQTPQDLYDVLNREFDFEFDCCANESNAKCENWTDDISDWWPSIDTDNYESYWMNPPYSRGKIAECMGSAVCLSEMGKTVVCLVRFDPSTEWFQELVDGVASEVRMLDRRVKFVGAPSAYNFPCCVAVYNSSKRISHRPPTEYFIWGWK